MIILVLFLYAKIVCNKLKNSRFNSFFIKNTINSYDNCTICLEKINNNMKTFACKHSFHSNCIIDLLEIKEECQNCRNILSNNI